jgi:hypothetical protein
MTTSYTNKGAAVKSGEPPAPPEEPEIELIAYQVIRTNPRCVTRIPIAVNGRPVKTECADPAAVHSAFVRFLNARMDADPRVRRIVEETLAECRAEEAAAAQ